MHRFLRFLNSSASRLRCYVDFLRLSNYGILLRLPFGLPLNGVRFFSISSSNFAVIFYFLALLGLLDRCSPTSILPPIILRCLSWESCLSLIGGTCFNHAISPDLLHKASVVVGLSFRLHHLLFSVTGNLFFAIGRAPFVDEFCTNDSVVAPLFWRRSAFLGSRFVERSSRIGRPFLVT